MTGLLLQIGATKLAVSVVLACAVWMVHRSVDRPAVSCQLWLMVLVTLLVPTVVAVPVLPAEAGAALAAPPVGALPVASAELSGDPAAGLNLVAFLQPGLAVLWLGGTAGFLGWTAVRTIRFRRTLKRAVRPAPPWLRRQAAAVARDLGLSRIPELSTTRARVTPMVWWSGGKVRMLIPSFLLTDPGSEELRAILAHELAHVRRRDHLVRWVEWLACSVFWWNPAAWWARHQFRIAEESCCDELAVGAAGACPKVYARALLRVAANSSDPPGFRTPLPASATGELRHTGSLERRIRMIVSTDTRPSTPRWLRTASRVAVVCALPFGLVYCDQRAPTEADDATTMDPARGTATDTPDRVSAAVGEYLESLSHRGEELAERIREAVESGELSEQRGRELSELVTGAASGLLVRYSPDLEISEEDVQAALARLVTDRSRKAELLDALQEMQELIEQIRRAPEEERRRLSDRTLELSRRVREASSAYLGDGGSPAAQELSLYFLPEYLETLTESNLWRRSSN